MIPQVFSRAGSLAVAGLVAASALMAAPAVPADTAYRIELTTNIKEKPYKFFITTEPVAASCAMEFSVKKGGENDEVSLQSMHDTWKTTAMNLEKTVTPDKVVYINNKTESTPWVKGQANKKDKLGEEVNPLQVFDRPIAFLSPDGRGIPVVIRNPDTWVRFSKNFGFGKTLLLHRPTLPAGELKAGQSFTVEQEVPDPTYSEVPWTVQVQWTVDSVTGKGDDAVATLSGAAASTRDRVTSRKGRLTDGTVSLTSQVKLRVKDGQVLSAVSEVEARWKKDPADAPSGVMDYTGVARLRETLLEKK